MSTFLIKNADLYAPEHVGNVDVLIANGEIECIGADLTVNIPGLQTVDAKGQIVIPGFIDQHVHVTGGGGEGGPITRCPELPFSALVKAGVTTVVGVMGTDNVSRSLENLLAKVRCLAAEGVTTYMWTSSYAVPPMTITGSIRGDLFNIPEVIGVKIALGDHRSSFPTQQEVLRMLSDIRVGGMISGKTGFLHCHLGDMGDAAFDIIDGCVDQGMPIRHIRPTHCARKDVTFRRAKAFARRGGVIDLTAGPCIYSSTAEAILDALNDGVAADHLTISTDAQGSMPAFNEKGEMIGLDVCPVSNSWLEFQKLTQSLGIEKAIPFFSTNLAKNLGFVKKGRLEQGLDADLLILNDEIEITDVMAKGRFLKRNGEILVKGTFE